MRRILKHISELLFILFILCGCSINPWFTVGLDVDTTAPELSITSHTDFDYVSGTFDLKGTCSDNVAITKVLVSIKASDGSYKASELKSVINKGHWTYTVATTGDHPMADGEYTFTVQAFDAEKNESSSSVKSVTLYIDNIPSKVTISYPLLRSSVS
ncbi:MAG: hypothetical protein IKN25_06865, partial [Spirochaetales bacterium]|nr:hypothetical protein [Spirochaetales bacterium]